MSNLRDRVATLERRLDVYDREREAELRKRYQKEKTAFDDRYSSNPWRRFETWDEYKSGHRGGCFDKRTIRDDEGREYSIEDETDLLFEMVGRGHFPIDRVAFRRHVEADLGKKGLAYLRSRRQERREGEARKEGDMTDATE